MNNHTHAQELAALNAHFPNEGPEQLRRWLEVANGVRELEHAPADWRLNNEEQKRFSDALAEANDHLAYWEPYKISVVGVTGAGKSALINALIGENLLRSRGGAAATGTIVTVRQLAASAERAPSKTAIIYYYTAEQLTTVVKQYAEALDSGGFTPVYTLANPQVIDIDKTLQLIENMAAGRPRSILDENRNQLPLTANNRKVLKDLHDLLTVVSRHRAKMELELGERKELDASTIEWLKEVMDEGSDLNKKNAPTRIIPLIKQIVIEVVKEASLHRATLTDVELTDLPGSLANVWRHDQRLLDQLDPDKNNAIILVLRYDRPGEGIEELVEKIKRVIMGRLHTDEQRRRAAGRFFLVVNKSDMPSYDQSQNAIKASVQTVARAISERFLSDHSQNIFYGVKAPIGLIAHLIQSHPEAARKWMLGHPEAIFDGLAYQDYRHNVERAKEESGQRDDHEAMRQWSGIPRLQSKLQAFLQQERFKRDLEAAEASYDNAYRTVKKSVTAEWKTITKENPDKNPKSQLDNYLATQRETYKDQIDEKAQEMAQNFEEAYKALHKRRSSSRSTLTRHLKSVRNNILQEISQHTEQPEFQNSLIEGRQTQFTTTILDRRGDLDQLRAFDEQVLCWMDKHANSVADTMTRELRQSLQQHNVQIIFATWRGYWPDAGKFQQIYEADVLDNLHQVYTVACYGYLFGRLREYEVVRDIAKNIPNFQSLLEKEEEKAQAKREIVKAIRDTYEETFDKLILVLNDPLHDLFIYHSRIACGDLEQIIKQMKKNLNDHVKKEDSALRSHLDSLILPQYNRLQELANLLAWLHSLRTASRAT